MTFVVAEILADERGRITILADTKLTDSLSATATRHVLTRPCLKIVIVDDDIAVAVAGDTPDKSIEYATGLRGKTVAEVVEALRQYSADWARMEVSKSFLVAKRAPGPELWRIKWGDVEDGRHLPRLWIGHRDAFNAFQRQYNAALHDRTAEYRLVAAMHAVVMFDDIPTVGGYITRLTGDATRPFRFASDQAGMAPWETEWTFVERNGTPTVMVRVPPGVDPSSHTRIAVPGGETTFGAMAYFIPEITTAWIWTHEKPWREPIKLSGVKTMLDVVRRAEQEHGQLLEPPATRPS